MPKSVRSGEVTEFSSWLKAESDQKSYLVQVLHWFYYRPARLRSSWKQEEVLTWELIRAVEILPHSLFLRPMLERFSLADGRIKTVVDDLLGAEELEISPYPGLGLPGSKRNCKSDIGISRKGGACLWIEAKTAPFKPADLETQLQQQSTAMAQLMPHVPTALVTLLPRDRALSRFASLDWLDVEVALEQCLERMIFEIPEVGLSRGYRVVAAELLGRIRSHPNRASGWV